MKIKNNKINSYIAFLILLSFVLYVYFKETGKYKKLREKGIITTGYITDFKNAAKTSHDMIYSFVYKGQKYNDNATGMESSLVLNNKEKIIGKCFPVLFYKDDPKINDILMFPEDFKHYNLNFPDSLSWVLQYEEK